MPLREAWSSRLVFTLAAIGAAVGLGNVWKFPFMAGTNGGSAFVLVYLVCALAIAIPILIAELLIGRSGGASPPTAMANLAYRAGRSGAWSLLGWTGAAVGFLIVSFYSVIAGWAMAYVIKAAGGAFHGLDAAGAQHLYDALLADALGLSLWHGAFMVATTFIVARGLSAGIERAVHILMPALFGLLVVMVGYAAYAGAFADGVRFLFAFDLASIHGHSVLMAVGQAFFSIGVAMGLMMMYGAYIPSHISIARSAVVIGIADTAVALLAGLAIFPLVFGNGLDPGQGPGLIFVTLPIAFGSMVWGSVFGCLFFVLLTFAAVTSSIALLEPLVARLAEREGSTRPRCAVVAGAAAWLVGLGTVLSFNHWSEFFPLQGIAGFDDKTVFDVIDYLTANILMPAGGMCIALFTGWLVSRKTLLEALDARDGTLFRVWHWAIRIPVPVAIGAVFLTNLG